MKVHLKHKLIKMSFIQRLNDISESTYGYIKFDKLIKNKPYKVLGFAPYKSAKYNAKRIGVRANFEEGYLILPERFDASLSEMENMETDNLYIIYKGREEEGNKLQIEFIEKKFE